MTVRVLIVDDEEPARQLLREYLGGMPGYEVVGECSNGFEAVKSVAEHNPDILLLDIQMPKLDGFEVLELIEREVAVVFVTAFDEHALRAFEVHAVDYLLKPFSEDRLAQALTRAEQRAGVAHQPELEGLAREARPQRGFVERILVRDGSNVHVVAVDDVDFVEAADDAVVIQACDERHHKLKRLSALEQELDPGRFVRIHRSYILNLDRLDRIELYAKDSRLAILKDGTRLPVSRSGYTRLRDLL
jgi:two-component system LytT family response regulator